jgi:hypothetical protein
MNFIQYNERRSVVREEMTGMTRIDPPPERGFLRNLTGRFRGDLAAKLGATLLLVGAVSTYWDIATHIDIGRERFLTPAHIGIYSAVLLSAIAIALSGLADHFHAGDSFLDALRHPFRNLRPGIGVAGAGMLTALVAAPIDNAWHELYGIDVTIWSPPHLLAIFGIAASTLGLAALVAPAVLGRNSAIYPVLLAGFMTALLITTAEFEFNAPQYRIAYHPIILAASSALVFTTAAGRRWRATTVALWFEGVRIASVLYLLAEGRSLPFVPVVLPAAIVADLMIKNRRQRGPAMGATVAVVAIISNWIALELLPGLHWPVDDLVLGVPLALVAGALAGLVGAQLGDRLEGVRTTTRLPFAVRRAATAALIPMILILMTSPVLAHEVGGRRGTGVITWSPRVPEAEETIDIHISDLSLDSGVQPDNLRIEAWRAEHRIQLPVNDTSNDAKVELTLPEEGLWFLFVRAKAGQENLMWGDHFTIAEDGGGESGIHRQRFTLGVDTLAVEEPPAWVDATAYGVSILVLGLLLLGVVRSLRRLPFADAPRAAPV